MPLKPWCLGLATLLATTAPAGAACQVDVRPVAFGTVEPGRTATGTGRIVVTCDTAARFKIGIVGGSSRRMTGPNGARLAYELYQDPAHAIRWGDGGHGSLRAAATDAKGRASLTVYGVMPKQADMPAGQYLDQLEVTLTF